VQYQYDQLGRLTRANTRHDGFGNLTQQSVTKGQMTGFTLSINPATNRVTGQNYDANGNWLGSWGQSQTYDIDNRVHTASSTQHQETYLYSTRNERLVSKRDQDRHRVHFYGADGLLLGIYTLEITQQNPSYTYPVRLADQERIYFGGRLMQIGGEWVATDRLGSVVRKGATNYKYAPYGQEIGGATANDTTKFATYTRDSLSGLDYALNRYYKPEWGRFTSPDPYQASGGPSDPGSWNRYSYVGGDPVNYNDSYGLQRDPVFSITVTAPRPYLAGGGGGGYFADPHVAQLMVHPEFQVGGHFVGGNATESDRAIQAYVSAILHLGMLSFQGSSALSAPCRSRIEALSAKSGGSITLSTIAAAASKTVVYDGTDRLGLAGNMQYNDLFRNSPYYVAGTMSGFTVADRFERAVGVNAETMLGLNDLGLGVVFIRPSAVLRNSAAYNVALVMHESLHSMGFEDPFIRDALGIGDNEPSVAITKAFSNDCFGVNQ